MTQQDLQRLLTHETPLRGAEAARRCGVSVGALVRWIRKGKPQADGSRRQLEGYQAGRSWMTTVEALARFLASDRRQVQVQPPTEDPAFRRRANEATRRLAERLARM